MNASCFVIRMHIISGHVIDSQNSLGLGEAFCFLIGQHTSFNIFTSVLCIFSFS